MRKYLKNQLIVLLFFVSAVIVVIVSLYTGWIMESTVNFLVYNIDERLQGHSRAVAALVTAEELAALHTPEDMKKPLYGEVKKRLIDFVDNSNIIYAYYMRETSEGSIQFIVDNDLTDKTADLATPVLGMENAVEQALEGTGSVTRLGEYSSGYDGLISAFAPVFDQDRRIVAIAGVDISDKPIVDIRNQVNILTALLLSSMIIVLTSGSLCFMLYQRKAKQSEIANISKSAFLSRMSHEMRTPLNAVIGLSELLLDTDTLTKETSETVEKIHNSGRMLLGTINDILYISKVESGKFDLIPREYDVPSFINDTITFNVLRIGEKPIRFILNIDPNLPSKLFGDELRVKQIFNNLLSNAFKYTEKGTVEWSISGKQEGDKVWLTGAVKDSGIGIRPEAKDKIFLDYVQVDVKRNYKIEGTGLGLSITKMLVEAMNGTISVESEYGKGSAFTVRFCQQFVNGIPIGNEVVENLKYFHYVETKRNRVAKSLQVQLPYARVLVVDDVLVNLDVAKGMLKPYGMTIDCVTGGQEAVDLIREETVRYNAIFMDHMMPGMDGIEATRIIRNEIRTEYAETVPIIALTANAVIGNEELFLKNGFQAFLSKPIDISRLNKVINRWIRDEKQEQEPLRPETGYTKEPEPLQKQEVSTFLGNVSIEGIDIAKAMVCFNGDEEAFIETLKSYRTHTPPLLESLRSYDAHTLSDYAITIHGIKGSCYGISADQAGKQAEALEYAAKAGDMDFVLTHNPSFIDFMETFITNIRGFLEIYGSEDRKPKKTAPDPALLAELLDACRAYDMVGIDTIMEALERFRYETQDELVTWLRGQIDTSGFEQIAERLSDGIIS